MIVVFHIVWLVIYSFCWLMAERYDVQMFQQNSYRMDRYMRWWRTSFTWSSPRTLFLVCALLSSFSRVLCAISAFMLFSFAYLELKKEYKVKLVWTKRVVRLFVTIGLIDFGIFSLVFFTLGFLPAAGIAILALFLSKPVVLLANIINKPLESTVSRWYYNDAKKILSKRKDLVIIGVTGSYGKTSTKNFLYRILSEKYNTLVTPGNYNTTLGVVRTVREQLKPYHQVFVVEMGAKQVGDIKEICDLVHPSIGIVTAVGEMHLETFGSLENIQKTKFELVRSLPSDGLAVINMDSQGIASYNDVLSGCNIIRYGIHSELADVRVYDVRYGHSGTTFSIGDLSYSTKLLGEGNILDIVAALVVAERLGVDAQRRKIAVSKLQSVEHRLSLMNKGGVLVLDDAYNSNPEGASMALDVLENFVSGESSKKIVVTPGIIELGNRQAEINREFGRRIASAADVAVIVNLSNREAICMGLSDGNFSKDKIILADDLSSAVKAISGIVSAGDVVLYENDLPDMFR